MVISTPLYTTLIVLFSQCKAWRDVRHMQTLAWMIIGLIESKTISLTKWIPYAQVRAQKAQSVQRRFVRWLKNERIEVNALYAPLILSALQEWKNSTLYLALDTSMLWGEFCIMRVVIIYRGRAIPLVWQVIQHGSSSVSFESYQPLLARAQELLIEANVRQVIFLADRGFADTQLMHYLSKTLFWHWVIRVKANFKLYRKGHAPCKLSRCLPPAGHASFWHSVSVTDQQYGPVHLAMATLRENNEHWLLLSSYPTSLTSFDDYGLRFDIEENFLDDKSNGFQLEDSLLRSADALTRLCLVLAITTLWLVSQGTEVVRSGLRRSVDPHWFRGNSYLRIGWDWLLHAKSKGWGFLLVFRLDPAPDPQPAIASRKSFFALPSIRLAVSFADFAT